VPKDDKDRNFIHSFIQSISIVPLPVHHHPEVLPTQHGHCVRVSCRSDTGNCEWRFSSRSLRCG